MTTRKRCIDNTIIHNLALVCIADQIESLMPNSENEDSRIQDLGGNENDTEALKKEMLKICKQLRTRVRIRF